MPSIPHLLVVVVISLAFALAAMFIVWNEVDARGRRGGHGASIEDFSLLILLLVDGHGTQGDQSGSIAPPLSLEGWYPPFLPSVALTCRPRPIPLLLIGFLRGTPAHSPRCGADPLHLGVFSVIPVIVNAREGRRGSHAVSEAHVTSILAQPRRRPRVGPVRRGGYEGVEGSDGFDVGEGEVGGES